MPVGSEGRAPKRAKTTKPFPNGATVLRHCRHPWEKGGNYHNPEEVAWYPIMYKNSHYIAHGLYGHFGKVLFYHGGPGAAKPEPNQSIKTTAKDEGRKK
jgi:hypothetical protein